MATCKWCNKSGVFLSVSRNGLCNNCEIPIVSDIVQRINLINDSSKIIQESSDIATIVSRFDLIVNNIKALLPYEQKGITTINPPPSIRIDMFTPEWDNHIIYGLEKELKKLATKIGKLKTQKGRSDTIHKFYILVAEYKNQMTNPGLLAELEKNLEVLLEEGEFSSANKQVAGLIAYYSLQDWWFDTFTNQEREYIDTKYQPMGDSPRLLTQGDVTFVSQTKADFLGSLASWFRSIEDSSIAEKIRKKLVEVGENEPVSKPGYIKGRHYSSYADDIGKLKKEKKVSEEERGLLKIIYATEAESRKEGCGVAPWAYEQLAILYRKQKDLEKEIAILERFAGQIHAPGVKPLKLLERLKKARELLEQMKS